MDRFRESGSSSRAIGCRSSGISLPPEVRPLVRMTELYMQAESVAQQGLKDPDGRWSLMKSIGISVVSEGVDAGSMLVR